MEVIHFNLAELALNHTTQSLFVIELVKIKFIAIFRFYYMLVNGGNSEQNIEVNEYWSTGTIKMFVTLALR